MIEYKGRGKFFYPDITGVEIVLGFVIFIIPGLSNFVDEECKSLQKMFNSG